MVPGVEEDELGIGLLAIKGLLGQLGEDRVLHAEGDGDGAV